MHDAEDKLIPGAGRPGAVREPGPVQHDLRAPAVRQLAEVVRLPFGKEVRLPPRFARAAVERFLENWSLSGLVVQGPCGPGFCRALAEGEWAVGIRTPSWLARLPLLGGIPGQIPGFTAFIYPRYTVRLDSRSVRWLLSALEEVKPDELDAEGRPLTWVPPRVRRARPGDGAAGEADVEIVAGTAALPPLPAPGPGPADATFPDAQIRGWFDELAALAGFSGLPLELVRGAGDRLGFTAGRIWLDRDLHPLRVRLVTCPNSDPAEIQATMVHELGHALSRSTGHDDGFRSAMLDLAARRWGERWFAGARSAAGERTARVDAWVACGIRAAGREEGVPPLPREAADDQLLRLVARVRRLRELAADQLGLPEAIAAAAMANDLVTLYDLGHVGVGADEIAQDEQCDRWVLIAGDGVWRRELAHWIAQACNVFSLSWGKNRVHLFGRYADVVQAEYLFTITEERIERECERHMVRWRQARGVVGPGEAVKERVSYCDSAVRAFHEKLERMLREEDARPGGGAAASLRSAQALEAATEFAGREHRKRGLSWVSGGRRSTRDNAAGRELGRSLEVVHGVGGGEASRRSPKQLPSRSR